MKHLLVGRPPGPDAAHDDGPDREYKLSERQAEALLDDGVIEPWETEGDPEHLTVYHVADEFDDAYPDPRDLWAEIEDRLCRSRQTPPADADGSHVLVLGGDVELRPLSDDEAERLEDEGVIYADEYFRGERRTIYHVDPAFADRVAPEPLAEAIDDQLDTVGCSGRERSRREAEPSHSVR
jgi:hypothetical protein